MFYMFSITIEAVEYSRLHVALELVHGVQVLVALDALQWLAEMWLAERHCYGEF
jgi:hypothetical protein